MLLQLILSGISQGSIYALVALGMTVVFRANGVVNFAHGEFFMFGAFAAYVLIHDLGLPFMLAAPLALAILFLAGRMVERVLIRPIALSPHIIIAMMTVALSYLCKGIARVFWGREVYPMPPVFSFPPLELGDLIITTQDLAITGMTLVLVSIFFFFFHRTNYGRIARAASASPRGAALVGIDVDTFTGNMWGVAAALGAVAGVLVAPVTLLYPDMGGQILIKAFAALTLGGFGNLWGAVVGGLAMGVLEQLAGGYVSTALIDIFAYLVIIVVLVLRPRGLFGGKENIRV
ncbi:branched-chain amino acid ABC transporter permease [Candidimonas humi]|jgi:branched-chain amino acid transport system permease protein|uniref:Branched-chain amino acid ABC transporter permease n=1 Tax=Candidimonas humi TaxID=683355 RepID=A0ABV8NY17_9BURK|nr:branched-chain amino acid ABC transporter permease [Candidimonas humi]MBV6304774.1 branched-chain amino acid ABC transporter permease [Candidimonas humi]